MSWSAGNWLGKRVLVLGTILAGMVGYQDHRALPADA